MAIQQGQITITGFLGSEPTPLGLRDGARAACRFRLACTRGYRDGDGRWQSLPTTWITVKAFRELALNIVNSLHKGEAVIVVGVLSTQEWPGEDGKPRSHTFIEASNVGHDLNYGVTVVRRIAKEQNDAQPTRQQRQDEGRADAPVDLGVDASRIDPCTGEVTVDEAAQAEVISEANAVAAQAAEPVGAGTRRDDF
ncbi:single-stranded DNA-binding protein [Bifidobacterium italicum]|uniref:Single-stranded DNA-binding protein n=1 Tax=Bifidobacterium italicum TaxID=1960968 RepID=A0A2A2EJ13_9BIFI|nr:single-stranded DNA-binding protein [Bifidobacterium italicum]PAU69011.1 single-stranded DNA-binding protein [Bifidobacterium italicum]